MSSLAFLALVLFLDASSGGDSIDGALGGGAPSNGALGGGSLIAAVPSEGASRGGASIDISLPPPGGLDMSLGDALANRRSTRKFDVAREPTTAQLAALLWSAAGITRPEETHPQGGKRTAPSAFGSASIDVWVASAKGVHVYDPRGHRLVRASKEDLRAKLGGADWVKEAPLLLILVADLSRYPERVPADQRRDYAWADATAAAENVYLAATALGLGTCFTVSSSPETAGLLEIRESQKPIVVLPVGYPAQP